MGEEKFHNYLDDRLHARQTMKRKSYRLENTIFERLKQYSRHYDASMSLIVNMAVELLAETEEIRCFVREKDSGYALRQFRLWEQNDAKLKHLSEKYELYLYTLVNIALNNLFLLK